MKKRVVKTGAQMFDALHAYGLATVLATATNRPATLEDEGVSYLVTTAAKKVSSDEIAVPNDMFPIPTLEELQSFSWAGEDVPTPYALMDGLLAALFTQRGVRLVSLDDLVTKRAIFSSHVQDSMMKVRTATRRWTTYATRQAGRSGAWVTDMLQDYDDQRPQLPVPKHATLKQDITIPMTIDPSFGYSTRRPLSDGLIVEKTGIAVTGARYAGILAYVGATRFLRAQRVAGNLVVLYVPLASFLSVDRWTRLRPLRSADMPVRHAIVSRWLAYACGDEACDGHWDGLSYQILQTQGAQQSIPRGYGSFDLAWLTGIKGQSTQPLISLWRAILAQDHATLPYEIDNLVDCLMDRQLDAWSAHLRDVAWWQLRSSYDDTYLYTLESVNSSFRSQHGSKGTPLVECGC